MSNNAGNDKSTDLGKGLINNSAKAGKKGVSFLRNAKKLGKIAKLLKSVLTKVIGSFLKWLMGLIGPYVLLVILIIVLLLLVIDSVVSFDLFQEGATRGDVEEVFDNTLLQVFGDRLEDGPAEVRETIRETQPSPYPPISEQWLQQTGEMLKQSIAVPTIHHYFKNLENENYKPWHDEYSDRDASNPEALAIEFYKIINKAFDYYFNSSTYKPIYVYGESPLDDEFIEVTTVTTCTYTDKEGNSHTTTTTDVNRQDLPKRQIVEEAQIGYLKATIPYHEINDTIHTTSSSGNCSSDITTKRKMWVVNDGLPAALELLEEELVKILTLTSEEGKRTKLVQPQDLEYSIDLGQEIDEAFPKPDIDYEGFNKCYFKNKAIEPCLGEFVIGGSLGDFGLSNGWYPTEYEEIYKSAANACGIDWFVLAAVHGQETSFGSNPVATDPSKGSMNSSGELVGAVGHFQFMPLSWVGWAAAKDFETTSSGNILGDITWITVPANIKKYGGHGKDANNDGVASPWDLEDAALAAACYLKSIGYQKGSETSIKNALARYNGGNNPSSAAKNYANEVYDNAKQFELGVSASPITVAPGDITYPTTGRITSPYGYRDIGYGREFHYGIDIGSGGRKNVPIVSVADGVVSFVGPLSSYGNIVRVQHNVGGQKFETLYAHLASYNVKKGQTVKKGQQIGIMGNTDGGSGRSTGVHLHFETHIPVYVRQATNPVNPLTIIPTPPTE